MAQTWGTFPLQAPLLTRIGAKPTEWRGTRSLRSLVCLRAPGIAPARPIVAGRAFAPPACLTSIALQAGTPFRLRQASAPSAFSGLALTLATAPLRAPLLTRGGAIDITSLAVLRSALGAPSLSVLLSLFGIVGFFAPDGGVPSSFGHCVRFSHMFGGGVCGGATLFPCPLMAGSSPLRGLVARFAPSKGGYSRLPFLPSPARTGGRVSAFPAPSGQSGLGLLRRPSFLSATALSLRHGGMAVSHRCGGPMFARPAPMPNARHLWASFIGYRFVLRYPKKPTKPPSFLRRGASPPDAGKCSLRSQTPLVAVK